MKGHLFRLLLTVLLLASAGSHAYAFMKEGCASGECRECHSLTREEAGELLAGMVDNVLNVEQSPVPGLWVVDIAKGGRKIPIYIDYSKKYVLSGQVLRIDTKADYTSERMRKLNEVKADFSRIPLADALVVGNPSAKRKVVVFSDPTCHFCAKLHGELKTVAGKHPDVAFYVKMYSRNNDPAATEKARAIICAKSLELLESAFAGKELPPAGCRTDAPAETLKLAGELNIQGTPSLVLPDGRVMTGYRNADALMQLLSEPAPSR